MRRSSRLKNKRKSRKATLELLEEEEKSINLNINEPENIAIVADLGLGNSQESARITSDFSIARVITQSIIKKVKNEPTVPANANRDCKRLRKGRKRPTKAKTALVLLDSDHDEEDDDGEGEKIDFQPPEESKFIGKDEDVLENQQNCNNEVKEERGKPTESNGSPKTKTLKFHLDLSNYKHLMKKTEIENNTLLKTVFELKNNFPFKEHVKQSRKQKSMSKGNAKNDVCGLDNVQLEKVNTENMDLRTLTTSIEVSTDVSNLYFQTNKSMNLPNSSDKEIMKKSVLPDDLERMEKAPKLFESVYKKKLERKKKDEETAGKGWYNLPKTEITDELKRDIQLIKMRNVLDPKHHYKRNDSNKLPKYFQVGTIVEGAHEYYSARVPKKMRKRTMVDELLEDAELRRRNKKKFIEIQKKKMSGGKEYYKKIKNKRKPTWART